VISQVEEKAGELRPEDELRAQYVACSYLATACQEALAKLSATASGDDVISMRVLELMLAVEWDWQQTLQELAQRTGQVSSTGDHRPAAGPPQRRRRREIVRVA
jgi:predicted glycosyl hydrolase (DUF1957 family)